MNFTQNLKGVKMENLDKVYLSNDNKLIVTYSNGSIGVYQDNGIDAELALLKTFEDHKGPIMDVDLSCVLFESFLITISYDRSLNVYNLSSTQMERSFSFKEEN